MRRILSILAIMIAFSCTCFAQNEEEELQFGYTRGLADSKILSVGYIGTDVVKKEIVIPNDTPKTMKIVGFVLPAGIGAMSMQNTIEEFSKGKVQITIDPSIAQKINDEVIIVNLLYTDRKGKEEMVQQPFKIKAE
ncbi:MAG: hypothetical protein MJZ66_06385 [Bacteroidales bacterium]|nr:hypothetical protein [Bacteroidales bacterium]